MAQGWRESLGGLLGLDTSKDQPAMVALGGLLSGDIGTFSKVSRMRLANLLSGGNDPEYNKTFPDTQEFDPVTAGLTFAGVTGKPVYDTSRVLYRGSHNSENKLRVSSGHEHGVEGVSTTPDSAYAASHGEKVKAYYGKSGKTIDYFDLINEYQKKTGIEDWTDRQLSDFAKSQGYVASVLDDPLAGKDIRYFDPAHLTPVKGLLSK